MAGTKLEIRTANLGPIELRAEGDGLGVLGGYAAMFNKLSQNLGGFVEQVAPGAFTKSLADKNPVLARYNHDNNFLLGTSEAETLRLAEDGTGLVYDVDLPDTSAGRDVATLARRGDIRYSSFAFHTLEDDWSLTENGFPLRTLIAVRLVDVAPVNNPAYRDTSVGMRSLADRIGLDSIVDVSTDEIRERLSSPAGAGVQHANGQGDTHPSLTLRSRKLLLLKP